MKPLQLSILGIRGVPAAHGGFETFAEYLALYLVQHGWAVTVYCQETGEHSVYETTWQGVRRIHIPVVGKGSKSTIVFDWQATRHAADSGQLCLTLGYNTAVFCALLRLHGVRNVINMDGVEWRRAKWGWMARAWFWINERAGCMLGDHLVADHPEIAKHLATRVSSEKITTIAYGAPSIAEASVDEVLARGLEPAGYLTVVARPEPENSILEIVRGYSQKSHAFKLAVLGRFEAANPYHQAIKSAASDGVLFLGAIYDRPVLQALRFHSLGYVHGHRVGGTNPSLVEAMGAGNPVLAHDNLFNRWVSGAGALYFTDADSLAQTLDYLDNNPKVWSSMRAASLNRYEEAFTWPAILAAYETLLLRFLPER